MIVVFSNLSILNLDSFGATKCLTKRPTSGENMGTQKKVFFGDFGQKFGIIKTVKSDFVGFLCKENCLPDPIFGIVVKNI